MTTTQTGTIRTTDLPEQKTLTSLSAYIHNDVRLMVGEYKGSDTSRMITVDWYPTPVHLSITVEQAEKLIYQLAKQIGQCR